MNLAVTRWKVYLRTALVAGVAVGIGLILLMNRGNSAPVWFFWITDSTRPMNVTWLMLCTAVATLLSWWCFSFARGLLRDARELRQQSKAEHEALERFRMEKELTDRERRLDERHTQGTETVEAVAPQAHSEEKRP